jgi:predicted Zn-dependent protease
VDVESDAGSVRHIAKGDALEIQDSKPMLVQSRGFIPVLVVPFDNKDPAPFTVNLKQVRDWPSKMTQRNLNDSYDTLIVSTLKIQGFLAKKNADAALAELDQLQHKFPEVSYLNFFRANALFLKGDRTQAVATLKIALKDHPDNAEGVELLRVLGGGQ